MNMSNMDTTDSMSEGMPMYFMNSHTTPLWSSGWTPNSKGAYAGSCIFLIFLSITLRLLITAKSLLEVRWRDQALKRRYIVVEGQTPLSEQLKRDPDAKEGTLTANGVEESVKVVHANSRSIQPWRFSVDLPRAALVTVMAGVGYLLMLAVMTFNIGYYFSVLAGVFIGELAVGRYHTSSAEAH